MKLENDTAFNTKSYHVVSQRKAIYFPYRLIHWQYYTLNNIYYREDNKQIFFYEPFHNTEFLYYDFNLELADTFVFKNTDSLLVVAEIELYNRNGIRLKKLNNPHLGNYNTVDWLQGIGSLNGLLYPVGFGNAYSVLTCYEALFYSILSCNEFEKILDIEILPEKDIKIFPNPASDQIIIELNKAPKSIVIKNMENITEQIINPDHLDNPVDISKLEAGFYIIQLQFQKSFETLKFIKIE